jgi:hypothetical protein
MSDCFINWRFGYRHLQIGKWFVRLVANRHFYENKPEKWFERY